MRKAFALADFGDDRRNTAAGGIAVSRPRFLSRTAARTYTDSQLRAFRRDLTSSVSPRYAGRPVVGTNVTFARRFSARAIPYFRFGSRDDLERR